MKKKLMEWIMTGVLLVCFFLLAKQAAVESRSVSASDAKNNVIAVDVGHGGFDPGVVGLQGQEEKEINLEISLLLKEVLLEKGFSVVMTRETDTGLCEEDASNKKMQDMQRRIAVIEEAEPVLTVSIHQNSYSDAAVKGPQVFFHKASENSRQLALAIQEHMNTELEVEKPRSIKENDTYFLLKKTSGTIAIVECGFLTNPEEVVLLKDVEYQQKVVAAIVNGIMEYLELSGKKV